MQPSALFHAMQADFSLCLKNTHSRIYIYSSLASQAFHPGRQGKKRLTHQEFSLLILIVQNGTALMAAAYFSHPTVVDLLIDAKDPVDAQNLRGYTALYLASDKGHTECVRVLLKRGADVNIADKV